MRKILLLSTSICLSILVFAQSDINYDIIDKDDLRYYIEVLESDSLEGRFTASLGQKKAANFIASNFSKLGLEPLSGTYLDTFSLNEYSWGDIYIRTDEKTFNNQKEISYLGYYDHPTEKEMKLVFAGYGTDEEINQINVKDRMVLFFAKNMRTVYTTEMKLKKKGARGVIMANPENENQFKSLKNSMGNYVLGKRFSYSPLSFSHSSFFEFIISNDQIKSLTGKSIASLNRLISKKNIQSFPVTTIYVKTERVRRTARTENVVGIIKGKSDKNIIITAHYDHLGIKGNQIHPGADDNASGVAAMLEIAEYFKNAGELNYNLIFVATTGEEIGLWGSKYFVNNHSYDSSNVILNVNIDMIARSDQDNKDYLYAIGTNLYTDFREALEKADKKYPECSIDYSMDAGTGLSSIYRNSDQYIFHKHQIPAMIFHTGLHDDYHRPTDVSSKIDFNVYTHRVKLIARFIYELQTTN